MNNANWPFGVNYGEPNHTLRTPRISKYDGQGAWAKDSSTPPWGWPRTIAATLALIAVCGFIFSHVGSAVGF